VSGRSHVFLAARREIREGLRARAYRIGTAVQVAIILGIVAIVAITGGDGENEFDVGVVGSAADAVVTEARAQQAGFDATIQVDRFEDASAARAAIEDDEIDIAVVGRELLAPSDPPSALLGLLQSANREVRGSEVLRREGLSGERIRAALEPSPLPVNEVDSVGDEGTGVAVVASLLLYVALIGAGIYVTNGVVEEKSTRVIEVVLSAIKPWQLLAGKVIGIGLLSLAQIVVVGGAGLIAAFAAGQIDLPSATAYSAALAAIYFTLGYALYACGFAISGALVSRSEDAGASAPIFMVLVAAYIASTTVASEPSSTLAQVLTFIPPAAPMVVPARAAQDALPAGELIVSLVLMAVSVVALLRLAGRIYERTVLRLGAPIRLREALRLARSPARAHTAPR